MKCRYFHSRPRTTSGFTLVELLVVLGIIALIASIAIPSIVRAGNSSADKVNRASRELFTIIRSAKVYAATHNVRTAIAYVGTPQAGPARVEDSVSGDTVPVVDSIALVRQLTRNEMIELIENGVLPAGTIPKDEVYVPLKTRDGAFTRLPEETCILPDIFEVETVNSFGSTVTISSTGLTSIRIYDSSAGKFISPRENYGLRKPNDDLRVFPGHKFSPEGRLIVNDNFGRQRIVFHVGVLPNVDPSDRFYLNEDQIEEGFADEILENGELQVIFGGDPEDPEPIVIPLILDLEGDPESDPDESETIDIDTEITLYVATGRVKVGS